MTSEMLLYESQCHSTSCCIIVDLTSIRRMCSEIGIPLVTRQVYDIVYLALKLLPILIINSKLLKINKI